MPFNKFDDELVPDYDIDDAPEIEFDDSDDELDSDDSQDALPPPEPFINAASGMGDLLDRHKKLIFLLDDSGSMQGMVESYSHYKWNDDLESFRQGIADARTKCGKGINWNLPSYTLEALLKHRASARYGLDEYQWMALIDPSPGDDSKLRRSILESRWHLNFGWNHAKKDAVKLNRVELMKSAAIAEIKRRRAKYPESDILGFAFSGTVRKLKDPIESSVGSLTGNGGDTQLGRALEEILKVTKDKPSLVNLSHVVICTDGEATDYSKFEYLTPEAVEFRMVCDVVKIGITTGHDPAVEAVKAFCKATGGSYTEITSEEEFNQRFLEAVSRKMLLPATPQLPGAK